MKAQTAIRHDKEDLLRAAHAMIINHGKCAVAVAEARAKNLMTLDARDARKMWELVALTIEKIEPSRHHIN